MPNFNTIAELENYLNGKLNETLKNDVANQSKQLMQEHIDKDVYEAYTPKEYERTGQLRADVVVDMVDGNTLEIKDIRNDDGKDIVKIIESGKGYDWSSSLDDIIGARPFVRNTRNDLKNGKAKKYLKQGLIARGLKVR
jgi:hypothetical protein